MILLIGLLSIRATRETCQPEVAQARERNEVLAGFTFIAA